MTIIIRGKTILGPNSPIPSAPFIVGNNSIGSINNVYLFGSGVACKFTPTSSGTISTGNVYLIDNDYPGIPGINNVVMAVFSNSSTVPLNLLGYSSSQQSPIATASWVEFPSFTENISGGLYVTSGVPIWIAVWTNAPGVIFGYGSTGSVGQFSENTNDETYPAWNTWDSVALSDFNLSIYLTVNP